MLLGDAAHTMSPVMAQGLNAGVEDMTVFTQLLEQHEGNVDSALPAFTQARLPDVHALVMLNELLSTSDLQIEPQASVCSCMLLRQAGSAVLMSCVHKGHGCVYT